MIRGIHHVAIHTGKFDTLIDFYKRAFGFEPAMEEFSWRDNPLVDRSIGVPGSAARVMMLKAGNVYLEVFEFFSPPGKDAEPLRPQDRGYTHFALDVTDFEADYRRLEAAGMRFMCAIPDAMGNVRSVYGKDPDGNIIELQQLDGMHMCALERLGVVPAG